ncbi:TetR/AcrR family transcriptional regulator [Anaerophilus nitritogenes]|uniref:TetR/AcrR family transcriptional regulator n=1 Tax=Anaerophilus nitritogenes TaxID=2498136 RepID=UPI00101BEAEF|nr:TetR/AcrR family transcriptional regulator [Anaerophilus nitritogenes]
MARNKYPELTVERILDAATELFFEKGYENTTIQDIIDALDGLSKGAIYHHFKSKEEIIIAVTERMNRQMDDQLFEIKNQRGLTGLEKLRKFLILAIENPKQQEFAKAMPNLLKNPKFLALQLKSSIYDIAVKVIEPLIREGIEDGTIKTDYPKELSQTIILLINIWLNPFVFYCTEEELNRKYLFLQSLMEGINVPIFGDENLAHLKQLRNFSKE